MTQTTGNSRAASCSVSMARFKFVARAFETVEYARDRWVIDGFFAVINDEILLTDISHIIAQNNRR